MSAPENPPAFPSVETGAPNQDWPLHHHGMSLRDHFAGLAMAGIMMKDPWGDPDRNASYAYNAADAMLIARGGA